MYIMYYIAICQKKPYICTIIGSGREGTANVPSFFILILPDACRKN